MQLDTYLSESVRSLLIIAEKAVVTSDRANIYLAPRPFSFNWDNIAGLLKDSTGELEPPELARRSSRWFANTVRSLAPVFDAADRLCHRIAMTAQTGTDDVVLLRSLWEWTGRAEELLDCLLDSFCSCPSVTSAVESVLVITAVLERAFGNILRMKNVPVPFLLRDLLLEQPLYDIFGDVPLQFTRILVGMPSGLNARNLVWHGFISPAEMPTRVPATLLILLSSLGDKLQTVDVPLLPSLPTIDADISGLEELPEALLSVTEFSSSLSDLSIIPPQFLPFWETALDKFSKEQFGRCLVLLLPQLELVLRVGFCIHNNCPRRLLTAVQSSPHTTLDDMLVEKVEGNQNALCHVLGDGLLSALLDLLQRPAGPRIRDRLGHGECAFDTIPRNLAGIIVSVSLATATRLSKLPTDPFHQLPLWESYSAVFHPSALFLKSVREVLDYVERMNASVQGASALVELDEANCDSSVSCLEKVLNIGNDALYDARRNSDAKPTSLFRPRNEIVATIALWRTLRSLCVALGAATAEMDRRSSDMVAGRLRSRQRRTFQRMVQISPTLSRHSVCLVVMALRIRGTVARSPDEYPRWRRCIEHMEKYTEKLASYTHISKNRWEEIKVLISNFSKTAVSFIQ